MNKKWATAAIIILLLVFIGYMIYDTALRKERPSSANSEAVTPVNDDQWIVEGVFEPDKGPLHSVAVSVNGDFIIGGSSFMNNTYAHFNQVSSGVLKSANNNLLDNSASVLGTITNASATMFR